MQDPRTAPHSFWLRWSDGDATAHCDCGWTQAIPRLRGETVRDLIVVALYHYQSHVAIHRRRNGHPPA
jgi:hypothetical protein